MSTPNKERLRLWVQDLRTTDAKQARAYLRTTNGDCCLGRACEVYRIQTGLGDWEGKGFRDGRDCFDTTGLPHGVREWFGLSQANPELWNEHGILCHAQGLNDFDFYSFQRIADAVVRTYELAEP